MPDGGGSAGVHAGQPGPAAGGRHRAPPAPGLLPVHGALPGSLHARSQERAGMEPRPLQPAGRGVIPLGLGFGTQEIGKSFTCDPLEGSVLPK